VLYQAEPLPEHGVQMRSWTGRGLARSTLRSACFSVTESDGLCGDGARGVLRWQKLIRMRFKIGTARVKMTFNNI